MSKFEVVSKYNECDISLPVRKTAEAAGYDFFVAEDIIIPSYQQLWTDMLNKYCCDSDFRPIADVKMGLDEISALTKAIKAKPTLVPTGVKAELDPGTYLELSVRSSCPLKYWLILANGVGIIDGDYYNNPDNEGHIYFQLINLSPFPIQLKKGDCIGQGIIKSYLKIEDDNQQAVRTGGFGSTDKQ